MRRPMRLVLGALLLAAVPGCGASPDRTIQSYLMDIGEVNYLYKQIKGKETSKVSRKTPPEVLKARINADVAAMKRLANLSDADKLPLQIRYGPALADLYAAFDQNVGKARNLNMDNLDQIIGLDKAEDTLKAPEIAFLLEGPANLANVLKKDVDDLVGACKPLTSGAAAKDAVPRLRRLRYHLTVDALKLEHVLPKLAPNQPGAKTTFQSPTLDGALGQLRGELARLRGLQGGGEEAVGVIEPLPAVLGGGT